MSSSETIANLRFIAREFNVYGILLVFITGVFGEIFNIIIFSTLKIFRQTTCSFYLIITSIANITILTATLLRFFYDGLSIGLSYTALLCKCRFFITQFGGFISLTSMCLATIDQFISMTRYRQWNNLRVAYRLIAFACVFWLIVTIFTFIYYDTNGSACIITNAIYAKYYTYFQSPVLLGFLPLTIMTIFSVLAFFKIRTIASRQINIVRLSRDRQLTAMTLFHVLSIIIFSLPFLIMFVYTLSVTITDPLESTRNLVIYTGTLVLYYISFSCSFYIYCFVSKRFRKQVVYVLFDIHLNRWRRRVNQIHNNRIMPIPLDTTHEHRNTIPTSHNDVALY